jgi:hypothetical protein
MGETFTYDIRRDHVVSRKLDSRLTDEDRDFIVASIVKIGPEYVRLQASDRLRDLLKMDDPGSRRMIKPTLNEGETQP